MNEQVNKIKTVAENFNEVLQTGNALNIMNFYLLLLM